MEVDDARCNGRSGVIRMNWPYVVILRNISKIATNTEQPSIFDANFVDFFYWVMAIQNDYFVFYYSKVDRILVE
jgi:hypothetical protein